MTKWSKDDITTLKALVQQFGTDVAVLAQKMKNRTAKQIKAKLESNTVRRSNSQAYCTN